MNDLTEAELESWDPPVAEPADFEEFWRATVAEARAADPATRQRPAEHRLAVLDSFDLSFAGFGGAPVRAWLNLPRGSSGPLPAVVQYLGYSGGRGFSFSETLWAQAGYAHFVLDTRGQGWGQGGGSDTADPAPEAGLPHAPGFLTLGVQSPATSYYRRLYVDALRLLDVARAHPLVDPDRVVVTGRSQGGGMSLAVAGLAGLTGTPLAGAAPDVPFLCHFRRAVEICDTDPYAEVTRYLAGWRDRADQVFATLSYLDGVNFARRAACPGLFSVALMDDVCPPSTVYPAFRAYGSSAGSGPPPKQLRVYPYNGHEGGEDRHVAEQLDWMAALLG